MLLDAVHTIVFIFKNIYGHLKISLCFIDSHKDLKYNQLQVPVKMKYAWTYP